MSEPRSLAFVDSITYVELRDLPHGGPFWDHEGCIGDEWPLWESLGLSRETYGECMRWTGDSSERSVASSTPMSACIDHGRGLSGLSTRPGLLRRELPWVTSSPSS